MMRTKTISAKTSQEARINDITKGLTPSHSKRLGELSPKQTSVICDYILALRSEIKLSDGYRRNILNTLIALSRISKRKEFKDFTRADLVEFMNRFRKDDSEDPTHKWIGTYNANLISIAKFFKWLYTPNIEPTKRPKPEVIDNLPKLKCPRRYSYDPSDMWDAKDNYIFLKYCPNCRDRCFHSMEIDTAARPHELLRLAIKDIEFIDDVDKKYARIVVNGKTGQRTLPLIDSIPYVTQWISEHPQRDNRETLLLPNLFTGKSVQVSSIYKTYERYREYFTKLLSRDIPAEDKNQIKKLLKKPWNPYVLRHSAITEKSGILKTDSKLRQYAGWSVGSNMNVRYQHFSGGEATNDLLVAAGIINEDKQSINILQSKTCPSCRQPNTPDAHFCYKCKSVMDFGIYQQKVVEERERKDREVSELKEQVNKLANVVTFFQREFELYRQEFGGRHITKKELEKIHRLSEELEGQPDEDEMD
jgi:integrase/recombinase XerD